MEHTYTVALAGNPNVGKSTVFNRLTGLHQHTGNWPGKTVERAEGYFSQAGQRFRLVDLPGTYSLAADSPEEEVAGAFLLRQRALAHGFGQLTPHMVGGAAQLLLHHAPVEIALDQI